MNTPNQDVNNNESHPLLVKGVAFLPFQMVVMPIHSLKMRGLFVLFRDGIIHGDQDDPGVTFGLGDFQGPLDYEALKPPPYILRGPGADAQEIGDVGRVR